MLENLTVNCIAVHEIFARGDDRRIVPPDFATRLENLSNEAMDAFRQRITDALSAKSKSVEMGIQRAGPGTFLGDAEAIAPAMNDDFLELSKSVPNRLCEAQTTQNIPGGMVIVFNGTTSRQNSPFVAVIKAEVQDGFRRRRDGASIITEFVNDLFLTKATRLYKIGLMVQEDANKGAPDGWRALVYDHHIAARNREAAALYFYESFLGCGFLEDSAYETARFFNLTREFISSKVADREERHEIIDALYTYVKSEQSQTFTVDEFTQRYVPEELQDQYGNHMTRKQFPARAVQRDTSELKGKLKRRRFKYGTDIEFSASPEAIAEKRATIETKSVDPTTATAGQTVTVITIQDGFVKEL